ncbi:amino acid ABC transporter substrate-binding protein [Brachyspira hyodysenteriae]|uniref:amino acid ABC transporter substrate-binding protein n=1 Tax=Brachyspira hyodysenteriae TaxID=159 RepID=UPI0006599188|nr:amino acid ABC transporter substrate-binding protein [Brachyspira hyodysenteriae]KLI20123.1 amino acid ABC transporter substrate-binding protein [Brachyspira hyodysenteriae]KLI38788.1 amino acid ABC transporter substrate-binding protein [Brachyspira hyodysenteriae]
MKFILKLSVISLMLLLIGCGNSQKKSEENNKTDLNNKVIIEDTPDIQEDNSLQRVKDSGKLVLGLDDTFAPMGFRDENGEIVGFDIDLAHEVASRMGVVLETKSIDWGKSSSILTNREIDVLWNGVNINNERKVYMNFSKPYLNNMLIIVKHNDDETINSIDNLAGKIVGVQKGGNYEQIANHPIMSKIKELRQYDENIKAFTDLQLNKLDAFITDDVFAQYYITEKKAPFTVVHNTPFTDGLYAIGVNKSDKKLLEEIDRILDEMKADGTAAKISEKWFSKDIVLK